ncbi:MAG: sodium-extruding oxaloacetate decarboxylase subunit alpha [Dehalococcoidales bacterium]|nr:MAG: sodium-extruding oxaloacetate decarboxylase subunit alpha [Dehalococcoidales bacterium]
MGVQITETTLRDGHQSLIATRMRTRDMLPIAEQLDKAGFFSLEVWGGATFDSCIRFLNEDPWERLRSLRNIVKNTRLQMLLRGQNLVGYRHYADDVLDEFVRLSVKNGIDVFRIFDALNDLRNMEPAIRAVSKYKGHVQGTICYTTSPVHNNEKFAEMAKDLEDLGCDSICVKDMAGLISPALATDLVKTIKSRTNVPISLHSHCSSGMAPASYFAAAEAGVDILDTAFSAFGWGTSQPPTESMVATLQETPYDTGIDLELMYEIGEYFASLAGKYRMLFTAETTRPSVNVLLHQIPGGMLSNLVSQLREQNALDKYGDVLEEVPRVRADLGYPPLVTPTSQVVGIQAVLNVLLGERYKQVTQEVKNYLLGLYGRPPGPVNEEIRNQVIGDEPVMEDRPAEMLEPELEKLSEEGHNLGIIHSEEDLMTYALYPQVAVKFLRGELKEEAMPSPLEATSKSSGSADLPAEFSVDVDGEVFNVKVSSVMSKTISVDSPQKPQEVPDGAIVSKMQGMILAVKVKAGDKVKEGDILLTIEAMKMQNNIVAEYDGTVKELFTFQGEVVNAGDILMVVEAVD